MKKTILATLLIPALMASAKMDVDPSDTSVVPGVWCGNFTAAANYVAQHDIPLVLVWGNRTTAAGECTHCAELTGQLKTTAGLAWASEQNAVFCFVEGLDHKDTGANKSSGAMEFAESAGGTLPRAEWLESYPFVCLYWPGRNVVSFTGRSGLMYYEVTGVDVMDVTLLEQFEMSFEKFVSEVDVEASCTTFPFGDTENDRLEAVVGKTSYVDVPVVRTNMTDTAGSCTVDFSCGAVSVSTNLAWEVGETMKIVRFAIPEAFPGATPATLTLGDASAEGFATRMIWPAGEVENSPKNPYWIGEKTADTLEWGEWTMDIDVATNKVNAWNAKHPTDRAYAMILVEGCLWCPDCAMAEANIFGNEEFLSWAREKKVVFGVVDIPNNPQPEDAKPSLLRYESNRTSDGYVTLRNTLKDEYGNPATNETARFQSGAGYLSRHSIDYADALALADRNRFLMGHDTLNGGWNRPERSNKNRTGVPVFLLLRGDGTVAARWNRFSDVGPGFYSSGYLRRFEEMLAMIDDPEEETDDDKSTTTRTAAKGDFLKGTVSSVDQGDVYRISGEGINRVVSFDISGSSDEAELKASVINTNGTILASASGIGADGFSLNARLGAEDVFLKISPATVSDGTFFGYTNGVSTVVAYSVAVDSWASGGDIGFVAVSIVTSEYCDGEASRQFAIGVERTNGSAGAASVNVVLAESSAGSRVSWQDSTLSWGDGEQGVKYAYLTILDDAEPIGDSIVRLRLEDLSAPGSDAKLADGKTVMRIDILDDDVFGKLVNRNVMFSESSVVDGWQSGDGVTISKVSGSMPSGFVLTFERGSLKVSGAPRRAGEYSAEYEVVLWRNGSVVSRHTVAFEYTVRDFNYASLIPSLSVAHSYRSRPVIGDDMRVKGMLDITVPPNGRLSARYTTAGGSYSYSCSSWSAFDSASAALTAVLRPTAGAPGDMAVTLDDKGGVAEFEDPFSGEAVSVGFVLPEWSSSSPAKAWEGQYTVQLPQSNMVDGVSATRLAGSAYMAMRMVNAAVDSGSMLFAGVLPNGRAFSGHSTLSLRGENTALVPFYKYGGGNTAPYVFSGEFSIDANAGAPGAKKQSVLANAVTSWIVDDVYGHVSDFEVYGGYYNKESIQALFDGDFPGAAADLFAFMQLSGGLVSSRYGETETAEPLALAMSGGEPSVKEGAENPLEVTLRFSKETGVVSGEMYVPLEDGDLAVTYRAIALPGWQGCDTCAEGFVERPWAVGSFSFSDIGVEGAYRNGAGVELGRVNQ